jgi:hypothetical protein
MKKFFISLAALAAFSTAAAAAMYGDNNRDDRIFSTYAEPTTDEAGFVVSQSDAVAIAALNDGWLLANGENVKDPMEVRRFDEKNK